MLGFTPIDISQPTTNDKKFYCDCLDDLDSVQNMLRFEKIRIFIDENLCDAKMRLLEKRKLSIGGDGVADDRYEYVCRIASDSKVKLAQTFLLNFQKCWQQ